MKPRTTKLVACAMLLLGASCRVERTERPAIADPASVARASIETALDSFEGAMAEADSRRAATFFLPEGVVSHGGGTEVSGRGGISAALQSAMAGRRVMMISEGIDVAPGAAWQIGRYELMQNDTVIDERGRFVIRWQPGPEASWRIQHMLLTPVTLDTVQ